MEVEVDLIASEMDLADLEYGTGARDGDLVADLGHDRQLGRSGFLAGLDHDSVSAAELSVGLLRFQLHFNGGPGLF